MFRVVDYPILISFTVLRDRNFYSVFVASFLLYLGFGFCRSRVKMIGNLYLNIKMKYKYKVNDFHLF